jgi:hypothetical protein
VTTPREYALTGFQLDAVVTELHPRVLAGWEGRERRRLFARRSLQIIRQRDSDFTVDSRVLVAPDNVLLIGYWQSEDYFLDVHAAIRRELRFRSGLAPGYAGFESLATKPSSVAVHVRRGDYVSDATTSAVHGALGPDYYRRALAFVAERVQEPEYLAFSDDPEWVERELAAKLSLTVVSGGDAHQDLQLMSLCTHHVIANSSFSWWGAWLGEQDGSVVVAPAGWFGDSRVDTRSMVPARWRRL